MVNVKHKYANKIMHDFLFDGNRNIFRIFTFRMGQLYINKPCKITLYSSSNLTAVVMLSIFVFFGDISDEMSIMLTFKFTKGHGQMLYANLKSV